MNKVYPFPVPSGTTHAVIVLRSENDPEARLIFDNIGEAIDYAQAFPGIKFVGYFGWHDHTKNARAGA